MKHLMTIGRLVSLDIYDPKTKKTINKVVRGKWLASSPDGKALHICTVKGKSTQPLDPAVIKRHRRFHGEKHKGAWSGECPEPSGVLQELGLLKALTYSVPGSAIRSPEKNPYHWHHAFGDTGHRGGSYPTRVMPALLQDSKGRLFIKRRPGNIFKTEDWIIG